MDVTRLRGLLQNHRRLAFDTSVFIYHLEANPKYVALTDEVFSWLQKAKSSGVTSTITMTEILVQPYRENDKSRVDLFYALLSTFPNLSWVAPSLQMADTAAQIRARHGLRTPDALQAATAIHSAATGLITNDPIFRRVRELDILVLEQFL